MEAVKAIGVPLDAVAIEIQRGAQASRRRPANRCSAVLSRHHGRGIKRKPVADAVDAMIAAKTAKGVSDVYLADLRSGLALSTSVPLRRERTRAG